MDEGKLARIVTVEYGLVIPFIDSRDSRLLDLKSETLRRLKEDGLYDDNLLYMPFRRRKIPVVRVWGINMRRHYRNAQHTILAMRENESQCNSRLNDAKGLEYAIYFAFRWRGGIGEWLLGRNEEFAIAGYDSSYFNSYRIDPYIHSLHRDSFKDALKFVLLYKPVKN